MEEKKIVVNKKIIIVLGLLIIAVIAIILFYMYNKENGNFGNDIPDDYIAVFNGGSGEITYSTYIYKIDNDQANYGFKYINTTNTTESWGSSNWNSKVTKRGKVDWSSEVFKIAEDNCAYSYVQLPNDDKTYTIEEFAKMFTMD